MLRFRLHRQAATFLAGLPGKHARQIADRIEVIRRDPADTYGAELKGYAPFRRIKAGEYGIIYKVEGEELFVALIGKRNDDAIYKLIRRFLD